jgi:hypothetical protein
VVWHQCTGCETAAPLLFVVCRIFRMSHFLLCMCVYIMSVLKSVPKNTVICAEMPRNPNRVGQDANNGVI